MTSSKAESKRASYERFRRVFPSEREILSSAGNRIMRGSGLHHRIGSPCENQGKMPWRWASRRRPEDRSAPAASRPFGSFSADWIGGKGVSCSSQGIIARRCEGGSEFVRSPVLAFHLLPAVLGQLAHDRETFNGGLRMACVIESETKLVFAEEFVEQLPTQSPDCGQAVALRIVIEKDRGQRLGRGARHHFRAFGGIVLAVLGAAMDHVGELASRRHLVAVADEADLTG